MRAEQLERPAMVVAVATPLLLAFNLPPSPTLLNQCLAIGLTGMWIALASSRGLVRADWRDVAWPLAAVVLSTAAVLASVATGLPLTIGLDALPVLLASGVVVVASHHVGGAGTRNVFKAFATAILIAGLASAAIGCLQVFEPDWADGALIARSTVPGRAVGNLRQPNHLSTLLLWSIIAAAALHGQHLLRGAVAMAAGLVLVFALVLTASRTGILGIAMVCAWGLVDRRMPRVSRAALAVSPLIFALMWQGVALWAHGAGHPFGGEGRLSGTSDISSSRFAIWSNTLSMIAQQPWTGVGFGEFNLAWTLTGFPDRPTAFFDHTHNLPLQFLVELGVPLGSLVVVLLLVALVQAWRRSWRGSGDEGMVRRAAFMMVLMIGLHSLLEYPLWYAYFLLPAAFCLGLALSEPARMVANATPAANPQPLADAVRRGGRAIAMSGLVMSIGAAAAVLDYRRVVAIYDPPDDAAPLEDRIARGQRSLLFGHHADYAAATAFGPPKAPLSPSQELAFRRAPHQLLDVRLMIAWSQALAAQGDLDKARWLAARIREFRNAGSDEYFAPCQDPAQAAQAFQCQPPTRVVHWREFVQR